MSYWGINPISQTDRGLSTLIATWQLYSTCSTENPLATAVHLVSELTKIYHFFSFSCTPQLHLSSCISKLVIESASDTTWLGIHFATASSLSHPSRIVRVLYSVLKVMACRYFEINNARLRNRIFTQRVSWGSYVLNSSVSPTLLLLECSVIHRFWLYTFLSLEYESSFREETKAFALYKRRVSYTDFNKYKNTRATPVFLCSFCSFFFESKFPDPIFVQLATSVVFTVAAVLHIVNNNA